MSHPQVLLFDLGGVVVESAGRVALARLLPSVPDEGEILKRWHRSKAVDDFERGRIEPAEFASAFIQEWGVQLDETVVLESFASWVQGFYTGAEELLENLRPRYRLACLSNTNSVHWARLPQTKDLFDICFASHMTGLMKPDREAYEHALRALDVEPANVHFFDDLPANVEAARGLGIHAHQVSGVAQTYDSLSAAGLV